MSENVFHLIRHFRTKTQNYFTEKLKFYVSQKHDLNEEHLKHLTNSVKVEVISFSIAQMQKKLFKSKHKTQDTRPTKTNQTSIS